MKKVNLQFLLPSIALIVLIVVLSKPVFLLPPPGKILDPFVGAVQNGHGQAPMHSQKLLDLQGLQDSVTVYFDDRKVPHIFATSMEDLFFAQGYITASLRLWQMEFISYMAAGRLSEIGGSRFLDHDRNQRRIGIPEAARQALAFIEKDSNTLAILNAYTKGVNAYIDQLSYKQYPIEYKILDYKPGPWTNLNSVLVMKSMANTLSGYEEDFKMTSLMLAMGEEKFNKLYPEFNTLLTPVVNDSIAPANPLLAFTRKPDYLDSSYLTEGIVVPASNYNPNLGSNSWVVSGKKTVSGHAILCNDPHLNLTLPAVWLEMQLHAPGMNVYGVTIPGTPAIIIGFNEYIAWGLTNGCDDVRDWYKLKITEDNKYYEFDGQWRKLDRRVEKILVKGGRPYYDTVYSSIHGPIPCTNNFTAFQPELIHHALKWELHKPSNEFSTFIRLNMARTYADFRSALRHYSCPTQNFTFAGRNDTIAVHHQGNMPVKWPGQGKFILDGTRSSHLYNRLIPADSLPHLVNPACNYIISANQHPTNTGYPYYYNGYYVESRAARIGQWLQQNDSFDVKKMMKMQLDNTSSFDQRALPVLLSLVDTALLNSGDQKSIAALATWNASYDANDELPFLFNVWWNLVRKKTWDEFKKGGLAGFMPGNEILLQLIQHEPANEYFDVQDTPLREQAREIIRVALTEALERFNTARAKEKAQWGNHNQLAVNHLMNIDPFSRRGMPAAGHPEAINAVSGNWGPGWRMIVEIAERPRAYGIYAGGQSGDISSEEYDRFLPDWVAGRYYRLLFFLSPHEAAQQTSITWQLK